MFECGWVRVRVCTRAFKRAHVCHRALGLYHRRDNKVESSDMQAIWREFPSRSLNLIPHSCCSL